MSDYLSGLMLTVGVGLWVYNNRQRYTYNVLNSIAKILSHLERKTSSDPKVIFNSKNICIEFVSNGKLYTVVVPYNKLKRVDHIGRIVKIEYDDRTDELNYPCGVPLNFTAEDIGAKGVIEVLLDQ